MEFDYNKCPECGYINKKNYEICPCCGCNIKKAKDNYFEKQVNLLFNTIPALKNLFEETEGRFVPKGNSNSVLEKEFESEGDNINAETYQKYISKVEKTIKDIDEFKKTFELINNYNNCKKYIDLLDEANGILGEYKKELNKALINLDKEGAQRKALEDCVVNGVFKLNTTLIDVCGLPTHITIPDSATSIGDDACRECTSIQSIIISNNVKNIGMRAFSKCSNLKNVTLPEGLTSLERSVFYGCSNLSSVHIPDSITSIGRTTFYGCSSLTNIIIPDSVKSIGEGAFQNCSSLTNITIPNSVTSIGWAAFSGCKKLTSITIPNSVTTLPQGLFYGCSSLQSITIPFVGGRYSVKPESDTYDYLFGYIFGNSSYTGSTAVEQRYYSKRYNSNGIGFTVDTIDTTYYIPSSLKNVTVTGGKIVHRAFENCSNLTNVTIGNSVTSIGDDAFENCSSLTSITIPNSVTNIGEGAFSGCSSLKSITIPDSVTNIGNYTFSHCSSLTSVTIGDSVTSIDRGAFYNCSSLTSVTISNSVTSIGEYAFENCSGLMSINYDGTKKQWKKIKKDKHWAHDINHKFALKGCKVYCRDGVIKL